MNLKQGPKPEHNVGALIIRIGIGVILYYNDNGKKGTPKQPVQIVKAPTLITNTHATSPSALI